MTTQNPTRARLARIAAVACLALASAAQAAPASAAQSPDSPADWHKKWSRTTTVQVLGINDFHGNLEPPTGSSGRVTVNGAQVDAGGAAYLATHVAALRAKGGYDASTVVSVGDNIGASPLLSAAFHDEPTIEFLNQLGVSVSATGNHEYDEGLAELRRMQSGGCHPTDGCQGSNPFTGARFTYVSANVTDDKGRLVMPAYAIQRAAKGVRVGYIGVPLKGTPQIVSPSGVAGLTFGDEVEAVNRASKALSRRGVDVQVLLLHQGNPASAALNSCPNPNPGDASDIAAKVAPTIDAVFSAHTHQQYVCTVNGPDGAPRPLVQGLSFGRIVSEVGLTVDLRTRDVVRSKTTAVNHVVTRDVAPDAKASALVGRYLAAVAPLRDRVVGSTATTLTRTQVPAGDPGAESTMGNVIADAQLFATKAAPAGAVAALMNPGGVRADLEAGEVTFGEAFTVQPFGNSLVTLSLTGAQLDAVLEQQYTQATPRVLSPSAGLTYSVSASAAPGSKVSGIAIDGTPVDPAATYRITVNSFLADGGDGFTVFADGTSRVGGAVDIDAFEQYLKANPNLAAPATTRITTVP